jgi:hypothetical protein
LLIDRARRFTRRDTLLRRRFAARGRHASPDQFPHWCRHAGNILWKIEDAPGRHEDALLHLNCGGRYRSVSGARFSGRTREGLQCAGCLRSPSFPLR